MYSPGRSGRHHSAENTANMPCRTCVVVKQMQSNPNTLRPRQNDRHFADVILKRILLNENVWISLKISLRFVPKVPVNDIPSLIQIMAWHRPSDKPLFEPMMVSLLTQISSPGLNELKSKLVQVLLYNSSSRITITFHPHSISDRNDILIEYLPHNRITYSNNIKCETISNFESDHIIITNKPLTRIVTLTICIWNFHQHTSIQGWF